MPISAADMPDVAALCRAHLEQYELEQLRGNMALALEHQRKALAITPVFLTPAPEERRRVLVLLAPGSWQANTPIDFLIDHRTTTLCKAYVVSPEQAAQLRLPRCDVCFTAIAESPENHPRLLAAAAMIERLQIPAVNDPRSILGTERVQAAHTLREIPGISIPDTVRIERRSIEDGAVAGFPIVIRPVGSQAGRDLEKIEGFGALKAYLSQVEGAAFYTMPFVDYRSADGYYRKYRVVSVEGRVYPFHLAISPDWRIHYYNAPMLEHAWMREEEARFLSDFSSVFTPAEQRLFAQAADALGLEYCVFDCTRDPSGGVLIFEADPAGIVHALDDPEMFGYKLPAAQRIFAAFQKLLDRAGSR